MPTLANRLLLTAANLTSKTWPVAARLFPETLEIDDNQSLWIAQTGAYQPNPPLTQTITADLAIIGGGFTGVSTAYHFSQRYPDKHVVLLEIKDPLMSRANIAFYSAWILLLLISISLIFSGRPKPGNRSFA